MTLHLERQSESDKHLCPVDRIMFTVSLHLWLVSSSCIARLCWYDCTLAALVVTAAASGAAARDKFPLRHNKSFSGELEVRIEVPPCVNRKKNK